MSRTLGAVSYRTIIFDYIPNYYGELIPDAGKVKVTNPGTGEEVFLDMPVISYNNSCDGGYTFVLSLPAQVIDYQRNNLDEWGYRRRATFRFTAHNHYGQNITYECSSTYERPMEDGL